MTNQPIANRAVNKPRRPDLADGILTWLVGVAIIALITYFAVKPWLPDAFQQPGTPLLQTMAIAGAALLITPFAFLVAKRGGRSAIPNRWFIAHVLASLAGFVLVAIHSTGDLISPPGIMLLSLTGLIVSGAIARIHVSRAMSSTLGRKQAPFGTPDPALQKQLRETIGRKAALLTTPGSRGERSNLFRHAAPLAVAAARGLCLCVACRKGTGADRCPAISQRPTSLVAAYTPGTRRCIRSRSYRSHHRGYVFLQAMLPMAARSIGGI